MIEQVEENIDLKVRNLDPLGLDDFMTKKLYHLNNLGDVGSIVRQTKEVTHNPRVFLKFSWMEALAASRDLGFLAASFARHGVDLENIPTLGKSLIYLSEITDEVPRDTVFSYGPRNPSGHRMRTFTGTLGERVFIEGFTDGMSRLHSCISKLVVAYNTPPTNARFLLLMHGCKEDILKLAESMVDVRRKITPEFFTYQLRPYFPPLKIGKKVYMAPGGAQMPLIVVDRILWGIDSENSAYHEYFWDNVQYMPKNYRQIVQNFNSLSLTQKILSTLHQLSQEETHDGRSIVSGSLFALKELLVAIQKFRFPHKRTAEENFKIRPASAKGSGGYDLQILDILLGETSRAQNSLISAIQRYGEM